MKNNDTEIIGYPASTIRVAFVNISGLTAIENDSLAAQKEIKKAVSVTVGAITPNPDTLPHFDQHKIKPKKHDFL